MRRRLLPPRPPDRPRLASLTRVSPKILLSLCHPRLAPSHLPLPADPLLSSKQDDRGYTSVCCVIRSVSSPSQVVVRIHSHSFVERVLWFPSPPPPESPHFFFRPRKPRFLTTTFLHHPFLSLPVRLFFCAVALLSSNDSSPRGLRSSAPSCALFELDPERALDPVSRDLTSPTIIHPVSSQITTTLLV